MGEGDGWGGGFRGDGDETDHSVAQVPWLGCT